MRDHPDGRGELLALTAPAPIGPLLHRNLPGAATYLVLAIWSGAVATAIVAGLIAGGGASQLLLPASQAIPIATMAVLYRASPRFGAYLLDLDLRLMLTASRGA